MIFLLLFLVPALVALGFLVFGKRITLKEFLVQLAIQVVVAGSSAALVMWSSTVDTEIWNGWITKKQPERVSCEHSYSCNCRTVCTGKNDCSLKCDTCYMHDHDVNWMAYTSNKEEIQIGRVDLQGLHAPPRWTAIQMGEPTAVRHSYANYIKAAPGTLFKRDVGNDTRYVLPAYPDKVYDYYHLNRLIQVGTALLDAEDFSRDLERLNGQLGAAKQVNVIVVTVQHQPRDYFYALEAKWMGGKKNDVVVVVSMDAQLAVEWVEVMAWTNNYMVVTGIKQMLSGLNPFNKVALAPIRAIVQESYDRKSMKEFEYLKSSAVPETWLLILVLVIGLGAAVGTSFFMMRNDLFNEERKTHAKQFRGSGGSRWR